MKANAVHGAFQRLFNWLTCCDFGLSSAFCNVNVSSVSIPAYEVIKCTEVNEERVVLEYHVNMTV